MEGWCYRFGLFPLQTEALVLRSVDFGESDRLVHLLTPATARLTAIAKGAKRSRRRFVGTLDLFSRVVVAVGRRRPGSLARLENARLVDSFPGLRANPARFALACYLVELVDRLAPESGARADGERLFAFALGALETVAAREPDGRLRTLLEMRALDALGLRPQLGRCVRCGGELGAAAEVGFDVAEGGAVCGACAPGLAGLFPVHHGTLRTLEQGLRLPLARLDRLGLGGGSLAEARGLVARFQRFHVSLELRSERFLDQVLDRSRGSREGRAASRPGQPTAPV